MKRRFPLWQLIIFILLFISLACNLGLPTMPGTQPLPTPSATPVPLPPTIIETLPPVGSTISQQALLTIFFSEKMARASVEAALSADFPGGFVFGWADDATLTLAPKIPYPVNSKVTFSLAASAISANGLALPEPLNFSYQTPGPLSVAQILPASNAVDVSPDSAVVVTFTQPVVPLGAASTTLPDGLTLEPAAPGKGEWLNTSTYIFHANPALAGGIQYTAHVNPKLISTSGVALDPSSPDTSWSFTTTLPAVLKISADTGPGGLNIDSTMEVSFNQSMDRTSVETNFSFTGPDGKLPGSFAWNKNFSMVTFKPASLLQRQTNYTLIVGTGSHSKGGASLGTPSQINYQTVSAFGVLTTSFPNGQVHPPTMSVDFTFNAPPARYTDAELQTLISISPQAVYYNYYLDGNILTLNGNFKPGQRYTVTFSPNLKDRWGQTLGRDYTFSFTEPDAQPDLATGTFLPALFTRPDDPRISVQAVNVNTIIVSHGTLSLDDFMRFQNDYQFKQNFAPADLQTRSLNPGLSLNDNQPVDIDLSSNPLPTGFYFINIDSPEVSTRNTNLHTLVVSNLNVTIKASPSEVLIWAVDLRSQLPASNIPVRLYDEKSGNLASGVTDERGLWQSQISNPLNNGNIYAILGQPGDDQFGVAASDWGQGISPWDFGLRSDTSRARPEVYLYTERPVYRPRDTIHYRGILKNWYDGRYSASDIKEFSLTWSGPHGKIGQSQPVTLSGYGSFNGEYKLAANAEPGDYNLTVASAGNDLNNGSLYFQVADYRKPEINLSVSLSPDPGMSGTQITANVKAEYFFGAAMADLPFTWRLYTGQSYFSIPGYNTGIQSSRWLSTSDGQFGNIYQSGDSRTAADGTFNIPFNDLNVGDTTEITLEISASESGGFPVSARASITLHPESFYVGVRPNAWVGQAGLPLGFDLLSVDWDKNPISQPLNVAFEKIRWERSDGLFGDFNFKPIYTPVDSRTISSGANGKASVTFTPPDAGTYVLDVTSGKAHTQTIIWVTGGENAEWPNLPFQQIQITANQDKYKAGETAEVFIPNPFNAPVLALLTTERSTFKSVDVVTIPASGYKFNLPLSDDSAPNVYVSATLLGSQNVDFRQGYLNLPVEPSAFTLNVELKATPEKAKPGDTINLDLKVSDSKGQPVQAEFSMAVVDLAALALADPNSVDIIPAYYDIQPLGVRTGLTAAVYTRRLLNFGGGGGGGGGGNILTLRSKFPDTAYWKADILTDALGLAHVSLTLPDNLTTWEIDTRGLTKDTKVGQARVRVLTSKELLIRPQTPRFLVTGDHAELAAMVNNTTSQALDATVSLQALGLTLDDPALAEQKVNIPANGRVRVAWTGLVQNGDTVDAIFQVKAGNLQDASRPDDGPIPVLRYAAPQTFSTAGILTGISNRQEIIGLPRSFQPLDANLQVEISPSLAAAILGSLKALDTSEQPWSSEQIISTLLPNLATYNALKESGIDDQELTARLQNNLVTDLHRLMTFRSDDGGWRWTNSSQKTDPYLTAYVLLGLQLASESTLNLDGFDIAEVLSTGRAYLFASAEPFTSLANNDSGWIDQSEKLNRAVFYCYVLTQSGDLQNFNALPATLYENRARLDPWAKSMLALTLYKLSSTDERVNSLLGDLEASAIRTATGAHWESTVGDWMNPSSALFTTAVVVSALAERNPATPLAADAVRYLASQRDAGGRWASSYETAWVIMALSKYMRSSGELQGNFAFSATLNGTPLAQGQASGPQNMTTINASAALTQLNLSGANSLLISKQDGTGKLYYRAALTVDRPAETAPAIERGLAISRQFIDCNSGTCQPVTAYQMKADQSGKVTVKLTLTLPNDAYYLMVQDYIPAGSDILDTTLKTSQQGEQNQGVQAQFDPSDPFGEGWGWWYFNQPQIYSSHISWSADYLPAGTYELTYSLIPSLAGIYHVLPAHAWQAYFPEVQGTSAGALFEIKP